jgi:hypothetical protein
MPLHAIVYNIDICLHMTCYWDRCTLGLLWGDPGTFRGTPMYEAICHVYQLRHAIRGAEAMFEAQSDVWIAALNRKIYWGMLCRSSMSEMRRHRDADLIRESTTYEELKDSLECLERQLACL